LRRKRESKGERRRGSVAEDVAAFIIAVGRFLLPLGYGCYAHDLHPRCRKVCPHLREGNVTTYEPELFNQDNGCFCPLKGYVPLM
jgi:hypothetical protein